MLLHDSSYIPGSDVVVNKVVILFKGRTSSAPPLKTPPHILQCTHFYTETTSIPSQAYTCPLSPPGKQDPEGPYSIAESDPSHERRLCSTS